MKSITNDQEWPKFLRVSDLNRVPWNKYLLKPFEKGEIVKVLPINEQVPTANITVEQFRRQFVRVLRKDENRQWNLRYTFVWEIFEPLK